MRPDPQLSNITNSNLIKPMIYVSDRSILNGMISGFVASIVLALLIFIKDAAQYQPDYNVIAVQATAFAQSELAASWLVHFIIGTLIWGVFYGLINHRVGRGWIEKGIIFGIIIWLISMVLIMPLAGAGYFAASYGQAVIITSLVLHLVFGLTIAGTYSQLHK